jgi:hypothetical protein
VTISSLRGVLSSEYKGPRAVFSEVHVLRAILTLGEAGALGRGKLGLALGLGQGEVRTLIKRMKESDLILIQPEGCRLSRRGEQEFRKLKERIPWSSRVEASALGIGGECEAVLVRGAGKGVKKGIEQRDAAVRVGGTGALTAIFSGGHFALAGEDADSETNGPRPLWDAARSASPMEGDVLIVGGAETKDAAELGALAAALTLL